MADLDPSAHGNDERVSIDALGQCVEFIDRTVVELAMSTNGR